MIDKFCRNCGRYDTRYTCTHDNIERIFSQERAENCPMWVPIKRKLMAFEKEVYRKVDEANKTYLEVLRG